MRNILKNMVNVGVKADYLPWEVHFTRKMNSIVLSSFPQMLFGIIFFNYFGYNQFVIDCVLGLVSLPIVLVLNVYKNYIWAAYWFFCYGFCFFLTSLTLKMGIESFIILFYFPMITTMVQIFRKKETLKHLYILSSICLLSIIAIVIGFKLHAYQTHLSSLIISNLIPFNIILSFLTTMIFVLTATTESMNQEDQIKKILQEKEILLAEVFHRVKNNLNIVTSLLNLKKNISNSPDVQDALEDCRNRIFSMSLVHQNLINTENIMGLNFKNYIEKLIAEIGKSFGEKNKIEIILEVENVNLELSNAITCGLILNELITNSYKYARSEDKKLQIQIKFKIQMDTVELQVKDNGKGLPDDIVSGNTLGIELIKSLSDQINGTYLFSNNMGLVFNLKFKLKSVDSKKMKNPYRSQKKEETGNVENLRFY